MKKSLKDREYNRIRSDIINIFFITTLENENTGRNEIEIF